MKYLKQIFENTQSDVKLKKTLDDYAILVKATKKYLTNYCELENNTEISSIEDMWYADPANYQNKKAFPEMPVFCINYETMDDDRKHILYIRKIMKIFYCILMILNYIKSQKSITYDTFKNI